MHTRLSLFAIIGTLAVATSTLGAVSTAQADMPSYQVPAARFTEPDHGLLDRIGGLEFSNAGTGRPAGFGLSGVVETQGACMPAGAAVTILPGSLDLSYINISAYFYVLPYAMPGESIHEVTIDLLHDPALSACVAALRLDHILDVVPDEMDTSFTPAGVVTLTSRLSTGLAQYQTPGGQIVAMTVEGRVVIISILAERIGAYWITTDSAADATDKTFYATEGQPLTISPDAFRQGASWSGIDISSLTPVLTGTPEGAIAVAGGGLSWPSPVPGISHFNFRLTSDRGATNLQSATIITAPVTAPTPEPPADITPPLPEPPWDTPPEPPADITPPLPAPPWDTPPEPPADITPPPTAPQVPVVKLPVVSG